jgi:1-deoxy-D-xylulose-5-phosphate reductoisomerase
MKRLTVLGSTGSIGRNTLNVVAQHPDEFTVDYLTTYQNVELLLEQSRRFAPKAVAIIDRRKARAFEGAFRAINVEVFDGFQGLLEISRKDKLDVVVNALVGAVGLEPTLNAIKPGCRIALANKETLVIGGELVMKRARAAGVDIVPIDSEHSALLQCLAGEAEETIRRIILTASGGPFRNVPASDFSSITVEQALNHPNWAMGPKITIDSATLMNKGLEVIEAYWLFSIPYSQIDVVVHPQSIIHSMIEFNDGSIKAQLGMPDMQIPIQYALTFPCRLSGDYPRVDFGQLTELTFEPPDYVKFRCLKLAFEALQAGGGATAILNAANEEAVNLFLTHKIRFNDIPRLVEAALESCSYNGVRTVDTLLAYDKEARDFVKSSAN